MPSSCPLTCAIPGGFTTQHILNPEEKAERPTLVMATYLRDPSEKDEEEAEMKYVHGRFSEEAISSLPKARGWATRYIYQHQGVWLPPAFLQGAIAAQTNFQSRHNDIFVLSYPRVGSVWLKSLVYSLINSTTHPPHSPQHPLLTTNPHEFIPLIEIHLYSLNSPDPDLTNIPSPRLFSSHLHYPVLPESVKDSGCQIVYICRNPKDTFLSQWHFTNKVRPPGDGPPLPLHEAFELFCRGASPFGPFWEHVLGFWKESLERPRKILFLKYEDMKGDTSSHLKKIAGFLGFPFSEEEEEEEGVVEEIVIMCSFESLTNIEANKTGKNKSGIEKSMFFRRGVVGDWENYLTAEMAERLDQITREKLNGSGLTL